MRSLSALLFLLIISACLQAQSIQTVNGLVDPDNYYFKLPAGQQADTAGKYALLSCKRLPTEAEVEAWKEAGITPVSWLPPCHYVVQLEKGYNTESLRASGLISALSTMPARTKLSKAAYHLAYGTEPFHETDFIVSAYNKTDAALLRSRLQNAGLLLKEDRYLTSVCLLVSIRGSRELKQIAGMPEVAWIDRYAGPHREESSSNSMFCNQIFGINYDRTGPNGKNTYCANIEYFGRNPLFRLNTKGRNHREFGTNYPDNYESLAFSHGTAVSLYSASSNNVDEYEDRGMAEGATLVQMPSYGHIEDYYLNKKLRPLTLNVSASIGGSTVDYNANAAEFDRLTRGLGSFLLCFAGGNDGSSNNPNLDYGPGWANLASEDRTSKNNLTVHAGGAPGQHYSWACNGPTTDGRLKPDICAEGQYGTSFASPNMAGMINCLYESWMSLYPSLPRTDVIKAIILNTAVDADKKGIDYRTGFGTVNAVAANKALTEERFIQGTMPQGSAGMTELPLNVPAGQRNLRVLLYWHDFPGNPGAGKALVNDLDLRLITPSGDTLLPWVLDPTPGKHYDPPQRKNDDLNNVEQITLIDPPAGGYTIRIRGSSVAMGPQDFVLTYLTEPYAIEITSPVKNFRTARGKRILFTWNAAIDTTDLANSLEVYLQRQEGDVSLLATLSPEALSYAYQIPGTFPNTSTARLIVRQKNTGIADTSDYFSVMETVSGLAPLFFCPGRITLKWEPVSVQNAEYILYRLGEKYMEEIARVHTPVTSLTIDADTVRVGGAFIKDDWFAIAARHPNGALSLRSLPVSVSQTSLLSLNQPLRKEYVMCYGDSTIVNALELERDSIRWFLNSRPLPGGTQSALKLKGNNPGQYHYVIYQKNGCSFYSDTFHVKAPVDIADTVRFGTKTWNAYVFRNHDRQQYYGRLIMRALPVNTFNYITEFEQIHEAEGYEGCAPGFLYTIIYKRKGFTSGFYSFNLKFIQSHMKLIINGEAVYTSPQNMANVGMIWNGRLDENSTVVIEHIVQGKPLINLEITATDLIAPGGVSANNLLWLSADDVHDAGEGRIAHWPDRYLLSQQNDSDTSATVTKISSSVNYQPALHFDGSGGFYGAFSNSGFENTTSTFAVFRMSSAAQQGARIIGVGFPPYSDDNYQGTFSPFTRLGDSDEIGLVRNTTTLSAGTQLLDKWQMMQTDMDKNTMSIYMSGRLAASINHSYVNIFYRTLGIGVRPDSLQEKGRLNGEIAEIIHFSKVLTAGESQQVRSYLGLKYGFTLDHSYLDSKGRVIYTPGSHGFNIAGIGRDDRTVLLVRQGASQSPQPDIFEASLGAVQLTNEANPGTFPGDTTFAIWGNDGNDADFTVYIDDTTSRLQRVWKMVQTGQAGLIRFNFDAAFLPETGTCTEYRLLIHDTPGQLNQGTQIPLSHYTAGNGKSYYFADLELAGEGAYYFSLLAAERNYPVAVLEPGYVAGQYRCLMPGAIFLLDPHISRIVTKVEGTPGALSAIHSTILRTDLPAGQLVSCSDTLTTTVLNRLFYIRSKVSDAATYTLKIYFSPADSLAAVNNPELLHDPCKIPQSRLRWWMEPSEADYLAKLQSGRHLAYIDSGISYGSEDGVGYALLEHLPYGDAVIGCCLSESYASVATSEPERTQIRIYPNPVSSLLYVEGLEKGDRIIIRNSLGEIISREESAGHRSIIDVPPYKGFLTVTVWGKKGIRTSEKLIRM